MWHLLRRHPFAVAAHFDFTLALTYAIAPEEAQLPDPLVPDQFEGHAFLAIAAVQTRRLRPAALPSWLGQDFFLAGYRIFCRPRGSSRRGLKILASYTDSRRMVLSGNLFTRYNYRICQVDSAWTPQRLGLRIASPDAQGNLGLTAHLDSEPWLPPDSPFPSVAEARRFAGPMPYTFTVEPETGHLLSVRGVRDHWDPRPVRVDVDQQASFLHAFPSARLASAWYVANIDYRWERGEVIRA